MYSNILVPLDGSELSERALLHAAALARAYSATIHLVHVFTRSLEGVVAVGGLDPGMITPRMLELSRELEEAEIANSEQYLERTAARLRGDGIRAELALRGLRRKHQQRRAGLLKQGPVLLYSPGHLTNGRLDHTEHRGDVGDPQATGVQLDQERTGGGQGGVWGAHALPCAAPVRPRVVYLKTRASPTRRVIRRWSR